MIVVRLQGGLGNQLFQYAFGHRARAVTGRPLVFDTRLLRSIGAHGGYELERLGLEVEADIASLRRHFPGWRVWLLEHLPKSSRASWGFLEEPSVEQLQQSNTPAILVKGYWQTADVSNAATACVRDAVLRCSHQTLSEDPFLLEIRGQANSVAVHIRRGDYVANPKIRGQFGPCSLEYFLGGMHRMRDRLDSPRFFVFSDDPAWAESAFSGQRDICVVAGPTSAVADFCRMACCRHFVLSNSSLSWWAAHVSGPALWAGAGGDLPVCSDELRAEGEVIYPTPWFDSPKLMSTAEHLAKPGWVGMPKTVNSGSKNDTNQRTV